MTSLRFARRTLREIDRIETWCQTNQRALWPIFTAELAQVIRLLRVAPELGPPYEAAAAPGARRVLLGESQFYVYYRYHRAKELVVVLSIWSTRRRQPPFLP